MATPELSISKKYLSHRCLMLFCAPEQLLKYHLKPTLLKTLYSLRLAILEGVGSYFKEGNGIKYRNKKRQKGKYENRADGEWQHWKDSGRTKQLFSPKPLRTS